MNKTYLKICYFNLKEKYLCDGIQKEDFFKITNKVKENGLTLEEVL